MRTVLFLTAGLAIFAAASVAAEEAENSAGLLEGMTGRELGTALDQIEKIAAGRAAVHDCNTAVSDYEIAIAIARRTNVPAKVALYDRRIGLCRVEQARNDLALAAYQDGIAAAEQTDDIEILEENLHGAAVQLGRFGRFPEELPIIEREYALAEKCGHPDHQLRALMTYGSTMYQTGRLKQALVLGERAVEVSRRSTLPHAFELATGNLAQYYAALGDFDSGLRLLGTLKEPTANDLDAQGIMQKHMHRYAEAERAFEAGLAKSTELEVWRSHEAILINFGGMQREEGKRAEARATLNEALSVAMAHRDLLVGSLANAELAENSSDEKNAADALRYADEALRLARESTGFVSMSTALIARGRALDLAGRGTEAGQDFAEAVSIAEAARVDTPASSAGLQDELIEWLPAYAAAVDHEVREGSAMDALRLADRAKARVLLDMLDGGEAGFEAFADPAERAEEAKQHAEVARLRHAEIAKPDAASRNALEKALRAAEDVDLRLYARHPELVLQRAAAPDITPEQLAELADGRTAILSYFTRPDAIALFVIRAGDKPGVPAVTAFTLPSADKLAGRIQSFRNQIAARDLDYRGSARELFDTLIGPAASALRGSERWIVSPDGALWDVPFQALVEPSGKHVLETHALTYAPSLATLRQLRQTRAAGETKIALLAVANPVAKGAAPIPAAERESQAIAALYGKNRAVLLTSERAQPALFRENAGSAAVIHIASHAETEPNHPLESFLLFTPDAKNDAKNNQGDGQDDGALTARDLLAMRLHANLVVLSACETARGKIGEGEGVLGLGWAVLAAGARAAAVSQWKVDSDATSDLMIGFHQRLTGNHPMDKAEALRESALTLMRSPGRRHPFYWASFMIIGDAR